MINFVFIFAVLLVYSVLLVSVGSICAYLLDKKIFADIPFSIAFSLGLGVSSVYWQLIALTTGLKSGIILFSLFLSLLFTIFIRPKYYNLFQRIKESISQRRQVQKSSFVIAVLLLLLITIHALGSYFTPVTGDSEAFYMTWPKIIAFTGNLIPQPNYYSFSQIGVSGELHSALLIKLFGEGAAKLFIWFISISVLMNIYRLYHLLAGKNDFRYFTVFTLVMSSSAFTVLMYSGNVNIVSASFAVAAYYFAFSFYNTGNRKTLVLVGILTGLASVAKLSYIPVMVFSIGLIILLKHIRYDRNNLSRHIISSGGIVVIFFLLMFVPMIIKNVIFFNEPFAPFYYFADLEGGLIEQSWYSKSATKKIISTYPVALIFGKYPMQNGNISPLLLLLLPVMLRPSSKNKFSNKAAMDYTYLVVIFLLTITLWVILKPSVLAPRYILAPLLMFIPIYGLKISRESFKSVIKPGYIYLCVLMTIMISFIDNSNAPFSIPSVMKTLKYEIIDKNPIQRGYSNSAEFINNTVKDERVYLYGYYSYYLRPEIILSLNTDKENTIISNEVEKKNEISVLREKGFRYVYIQKASHRQKYEKYLQYTSLHDIVLLMDNEEAAVFYIP